MTKIGIVGTRRRDSKQDFIDVVGKFSELKQNNSIIVSGGCPKGADRFAERIARDWNLPIVIHYASWSQHGKNAGFIRNTKIAEESDILIACVAEDRTGGTEDTIRKFVKLKGDKNLHIV